MPADLNDYFKKRNNNGNQPPRNNGGDSNIKMPQFNGFNKKFIPIYVVIAAVVLMFIAKPYAIINSGELGIKVTTGKYSPNTLAPGLHFFIPIFQNIVVVDAKVRMMSYTSTEQMASFSQMADSTFYGRGASGLAMSSIIQKEAISVKDARNLDFHIDLAVQYQLERPNAPSTVAEWGLNWENKIIDPAVREIVREVAGRYNAEDIPQKRSVFADQIKDSIKASIEGQAGKPVVLLSVQLREIILPKNIKDQIERVQIARQETERTKYEVERAKEEAQKRVATAQGEADSAIINAQGRANAVKIEADAAAYANQQVGKSLTMPLLTLRQIEVQGRFNDALRENKDAKIFLTPGGAVPNIWVDTKDSKIQSAIER